MSTSKGFPDNPSHRQLYITHENSAIMSFNKAVWYVAATKKSSHPTLFINCSVKPGASKSREGVTSIREDAVEICVSAQAREGEANKAVVKVLSEVNENLDDHLSIQRGLCLSI